MKDELGPEDDQTAPVWRLIDSYRGQVREGIGVYGVPFFSFCALLLLRMGEEDRLFEPSEPELSFSRWSRLSPRDLVAAIIGRVLPAFTRGELWSTPPTPGIASGLEGLDMVPPGFAAKLVRLVAQLPLGEGRGELTKQFDRFLGEATPARAGEWSTPGPLAKLMVELVRPRPGEVLCDPRFDTGEIFVEALNYTRGLDSGSGDELLLTGVSSHRLAHLVAITRLALRGCDLTRLQFRSHLVFGGPFTAADCVIAALPSTGELPRAGRFPVQTNDPASNYVQLIMEILKPGGRACVAVPDRFAFDPAEQGVRRRLLQEFHVEGVLPLPRGSLAGSHGVGGRLVLFRQGPPSNHVAFMDLAEHLLSDSQPLSDNFAKEVATDWFTRSIGSWEEVVSDLARNEWQLVGTQATRNVEQGFIAQVRKLAPGLPIQRLGDVVQVVRGAGSRRVATTTDPSRGSNRLIRVGDIRDGQVHLGDSFFLPEAGARVAPDVFADPEDLLVTISGTIGKVGRYLEIEPVPQVPTQGVAVLKCQAEWERDYIGALLESGVYQEWLTAVARGAGIQHVSIKALRGLPIPVLDAEQAKDLLTRAAYRGGDLATTILSSLRGEGDPLAEWLETGLSRVGNIFGHAAGGAQILLSTAAEIAHLERELRSSPAQDDVLSGWFSRLHSALKPVEALPFLDDPQAKVANLALTRSGLLHASAGVSLLAQVGNRLTASGLTSRLLAAVDEELNSLLGRIAVTLDLDPISVPAEEESPVTLTIRNDGPLPLAAFAVETDPDIGGESFDWLPAGGSVVTELTVPPTAAGDFEFQVRWTGNRLDGETRTSTSRLTLRAGNAPQSVRSESLGATPYIVGTAIRSERAHMLYGRSELLEDIRRQLPTDGGANVIVLEGNRRAGKTSLLFRLETPGQVPGWVVSYTSFQEGGGSSLKSGVPSDEIYRLIAHGVGKAAVANDIDPWPLGVGAPDPARKILFQLNDLFGERMRGANGFPVLQEYVATILERVPEKGLLLLFDEFHKVKEGVANGVTSPQVPENLRFLLQTNPRISAVLTGTYQLKRAREEYWSALFGLGVSVEVRAIDEASARRLVTEPVEGRLVYASDAVGRIVQVCARQPYLIQHLSNNVFSTAAETGRRTVTLAMVDEAIARDVKKNEHFATIWEYAATPRRKLLIVLCHKLAKRSQLATFEALEGELLDAGALEGEDQLLDEDLKELRELELVELRQGRRGPAYRLLVPLMGYWIEETQDVVALKRAAARQYRDERRI